MIPEITSINKDGLVQLSFCKKYHMLGIESKRFGNDYDSAQLYRKVVCKHTGYKGAQNFVYYSINSSLEEANILNIFKFNPFKNKKYVLMPAYLNLTFDKYQLKGCLETHSEALLNYEFSNTVKVYQRKIDGHREKILSKISNSSLLPEILDSSSLDEASEKIQKYLLLI